MDFPEDKRIVFTLGDAHYNAPQSVTKALNSAFFLKGNQFWSRVRKRIAELETSMLGSDNENQELNDLIKTR